MTEHTPTPWKTEGGTSDAPDPRWQIFTKNIILALTCGGNDEANAAFIVLAANALAPLVAACEALMELADDGSASFDDPEPGGTYDLARAALALAKEEQ